MVRHTVQEIPIGALEPGDTVVAAGVADTVASVGTDGGMVAVTYESAQIPVLYPPDAVVLVEVRGPYDIRVDERTPQGWWPVVYVEHRNRDRAMAEFDRAARAARYGPHGTHRLTLLGPCRTRRPGGGA